MYKHKNIKFAICVLVISFLLAILFFMIEQMKDDEVQQLYRKEHGEGAQVEELRVSIGGDEQMDIQIEVQERAYTKEELQEVFEESLDRLDTLILGENESLDRVEKPLRLIESIPNTGIKVTWELDRYDVMNIDGGLQAEQIDIEGTLVQLRAVLSYGEQEVAQVLHAILYPPKSDERAMQELALKKEIEEMNNSTKESEEFLLPKTIQGQPIQWKRQESSNAYLILLFGGVGAVYILLHEKEKQKKKQRERAEQMLVDYPEILNQFALLLGAGISVKNVWYRIVQQYQERKQEKGIRYAYEEMSYTYRELQSRVMETECYEKFGKRCQVQQYVKLGTILSQNLRKGSAGLTKLLTLEAKIAFEERKHRAKRLGEEAGTKLLLPMFLMLLIVLLIVIIPAFFSFQLA